MRPTLRHLLTATMVGSGLVLSTLGGSPVGAQGVDVDVDVEPVVVTASGPAGAVTGNTIQTVTVTVRNDLSRPITSAIVALGGIDNSGGQTVTIPASSSLDVTFNVVPCRTSTVTASVTAVVDSTPVTATGEPLTLRVAPGSTCTTTVSTPAGPIGISTTAGRVTGLTATPLAGLPTPPPGMNLPYGAISFTIEDLTAGESVTVRVTVPGPATSYAKLTTGGWVLVPGAVTIGNGVAVTLTDGGIGDADGLANGRIVDPGAVVAPAQPTDTTTPTTTPTTAPTTTGAPATGVPTSPGAGTPAGASTTIPGGPVPATPGAVPPPGAPVGTPSGNLPQTGGGPRPALAGGALALGVGALLVVVTRRRRRTRTSTP